MTILTKKLNGKKIKSEESLCFKRLKMFEEVPAGSDGDLIELKTWQYDDPKKS
jgi:hypothetical protein